MLPDAEIYWHLPRAKSLSHFCVCRPCGAMEILRRRLSHFWAREAREAKSATDGLFLYVGASFPARGGPPERSRDWETDAWLAYVWCDLEFRPCSPSTCPKGPEKDLQPE